MAQEEHVWTGGPSQMTNLGAYAVCGLLTLTVIGAVFAIPYAIWKYLVVKCQRYELTSQRLKIHSGVFNKRMEEIELYRVKDTKFDQPLLFRLFGLGNVTLVSSDVTTPVVFIHGIQDAQQLRERIRTLVENCREQKRVRVGEFE
ncbi:MAG: PH domain-containing protein [Rhodoferax sp.]|nr:PH domain-containing protein [Rhodoferax sp.]